RITGTLVASQVPTRCASRSQERSSSSAPTASSTAQVITPQTVVRSITSAGFTANQDPGAMTRYPTPQEPTMISTSASIPWRRVWYAGPSAPPIIQEEALTRLRTSRRESAALVMGLPGGRAEASVTGPLPSGTRVGCVVVGVGVCRTVGDRVQLCGGQRRLRRGAAGAAGPAQPELRQ